MKVRELLKVIDGNTLAIIIDRKGKALETWKNNSTLGDESLLDVNINYIKSGVDEYFGFPLLSIHIDRT